MTAAIKVDCYLTDSERRQQRVVNGIVTCTSSCSPGFLTQRVIVQSVTPVCCLAPNRKIPQYFVIFQKNEYTSLSFSLHICILYDNPHIHSKFKKKLSIQKKDMLDLDHFFPGSSLYQGLFLARSHWLHNKMSRPITQKRARVPPLFFWYFVLTFNCASICKILRKVIYSNKKKFPGIEPP